MKKKEVDTCWYHTYLLYSCDGEIWFPTPNDRRRWRKKEKKINWNYSYTLKTKWMSFILAPLCRVSICDHWVHATFELHRTPLAPTFTDLYFMILLSICLHVFIFCIIIYDVDIFSLLDLAHGVWYFWEIFHFYKNILLRYLTSTVVIISNTGECN